MDNVKDRNERFIPAKYENSARQCEWYTIIASEATNVMIEDALLRQKHIPGKQTKESLIYLENDIE